MYDRRRRKIEGGGIRSWSGVWGLERERRRCKIKRSLRFTLYEQCYHLGTRGDTSCSPTWAQLQYFIVTLHSKIELVANQSFGAIYSR